MALAPRGGGAPAPNGNAGQTSGSKPWELFLNLRGALGTGQRRRRSSGPPAPGDSRAAPRLGPRAAAPLGPGPGPGPRRAEVRVPRAPGRSAAPPGQEEGTRSGARQRPAHLRPGRQEPGPERQVSQQRPRGRRGRHLSRNGERGAGRRRGGRAAAWGGGGEAARPAGGPAGPFVPPPRPGPAHTARPRPHGTAPPRGPAPATCPARGAKAPRVGEPRAPPLGPRRPVPQAWPPGPEAASEAGGPRAVPRDAGLSTCRCPAALRPGLQWSRAMDKGALLPAGRAPRTCPRPRHLPVASALPRLADLKGSGEQVGLGRLLETLYILASFFFIPNGWLMLNYQRTQRIRSPVLTISTADFWSLPTLNTDV